MFPPGPTPPPPPTLFQCLTLMELYSLATTHLKSIICSHAVVMGSVIGIFTNGTILSQIVVYGNPEEKKEKERKKN